jgi:hypothetical protein
VHRAAACLETPKTSVYHSLSETFTDVHGEAMLTMQSAQAKMKLLLEAFRLLRAGVRYDNYELFVMSDGIDDVIRHDAIAFVCETEQFMNNEPACRKNLTAVRCKGMRGCLSPASATWRQGRLLLPNITPGSHESERGGWSRCRQQ